MKQQQIVLDSIEHISEKPWGEITKADYTLEQWHAACLIHLHNGPPTSKSQCKLPIKTPGGALNRDGVHTATAALHGARTPLQAPPDQKASAALALIRAYKQLGEKPPPSLIHYDVQTYLEHHGVRGMKWGVRRARPSSGSSGGTRKPKRPSSSDFKKTAPLRKKKPRELTNKQLQDINQRMNLEQNFRRMNPTTINKGHNTVKKMLAFVATAGAAAAVTSKFLKTPTGQRLVDKGSIAVGKRSQRLATRLAARTAEKAFPLPATFT